VYKIEKGVSLKKAFISLGLVGAMLFLSAAQATEVGAYGGVGTESLFLIDANGKTLQLKPGTLGSSFSLTLPTADGTSNQVLQTNGSGTLSWATPSSNGVPSGTIIAFGGSACPTGYTAANGGSYSTSAKASLFNAIGYTWGGSGANFNVPDLRNRFLRGNGSNGDGNGGDAVSLGAYQADEFKQHNHTTTTVGSGTGLAGGTIYTNAASTSGDAGGNESRPKSYGVLYCIAD